MVPIGWLDLPKLSQDDLALLARYDDQEAMSLLWANLVPMVERICHGFSSKYPWIEFDDLVQEVLVRIPVIVSRWRPDDMPNVNKYFYFCIYRNAQDALRRHDPLGIKHPQKKQYPAYRHIHSGLGESHSRFIEANIHDGLDRLDRGYHYQVDPIPMKQETKSSTVHIVQYHGDALKDG